MTSEPVATAAAPSGVTAEEVNAFLDEHFDGVGNRCFAVGDRWAIARMDTSTTSLRPGGIISGPGNLRRSGLACAP